MTVSFCLEDKLIEAQTKAARLFEETEKRGLIAVGISEKELNEKIHDLAQEMFGLKKYWHKRIVRAGVNALCPYRENPPNLIIQDDDLVFLDFGPVFEEYEADFGRTCLLGNNADKRRMVSDLATIFRESKEYFSRNTSITGSELYADVVSRSEQRGWLYGGPHAGHLIGAFPHEKRLGEKDDNYICLENHRSMRDPDINGETRHWILEVHLIDKGRSYGAFYEELLTL